MPFRTARLFLLHTLHARTAARLEAEASFVPLLEKAGGLGLWTMRAPHWEVAWSESLNNMLQVPPGFMPGPDGLLDFVASDRREEIRDLLARCSTRSEPFDTEVQLLTSRGASMRARVMAHAVRNDKGVILRVEGVVQELAPGRSHPALLLMTALEEGPGSQQAFATLDRDGRFTFLNSEAEQLLGTPAAGLLGRTLWSCFQKTASAHIEEQLRAAQLRHEAFDLEELDARQSRWLELRCRHLGDGLAVHLRDVTARRASQEQLRLLEGSIARLNDIVVITEAGPFNEPGPRIVFVNDAFELRTGYSRQEVLGRSPRLLQGPQTQRERLDQVRVALEQWRPVRVDLINYRKTGEPFWVDLDVSPVWDKTRRLTHWVAVGRDVTERKAAEEKIQYLAYYDALTRLPNRQLLLDRLHEALAHRIGPCEGALMFIDLDNFKVLNDTLGHQKGDLLLQQVAERLRACVAKGDTVARLGGDEFVILLENRDDKPLDPAEGARIVAQRILATLGEPYVLPGFLHHSTCSIGVTLFGKNPWTVSELLKQADLAMYQAKRAGRNTVCFFDPQMQAIATANAAIATDLRHGWREGQLLIDYQPQVSMDGRMTGVEALLRWRHPQRGLILPDQFIPVAEETTLILQIGRWVLEMACAQLAAWSQRPDRAHLSIAINVSARQFRHPEFVDEVMEAIARTGIAPQKLKLELTESLLADSTEVTLAKMGNLKAMGVTLSLDDFGMGYSSLSYLKRLPLDQLKIDREFVKDILTDANDAAIARTIVGLAQSLRLDVIAEGVETQAQRQFLAELGCRSFQGYLFCQPLPIDRLESFIDGSC